MKTMRGVDGRLWLEELEHAIPFSVTNLWFQGNNNWKDAARMHLYKSLLLSCPLAAAVWAKPTGYIRVRDLPERDIRSLRVDRGVTGNSMIDIIRNARGTVPTAKSLFQGICIVKL